jgi:hypothetical protein
MSNVANPISSGSLRAHRAPLAEYIANWREPKPRFEFNFGWALDYERLFLEEYTEKTAIDAIIGKANESGRVLIAAKGGAAKTTIVNRLIESLLQDELFFPVLLNINQWQAPLYERWRGLPDNWVARMNFLFETLAVPSVNVAMLDAVGAMANRCVFVDGINEVTSRVSQDILESLDEFANRSAQSSVIVTDRLARRSLRDANRWRLGTVLPLDDQQVTDLIVQQFGSDERWRKAGDVQRAIFKIPFFLNQLLHSDQPGQSRAATFAQFFATHALPTADLDKAAAAAFAVYGQDRARIFPIGEFRDLAGTDVTKRLLQAGVLQQSNGFAYFAHHLHHDYLASRSLAAQPGDWNPEVFDRMTFGASSFDILALCLEQLAMPEQADKFLTLTYDWNYYGTAYALADSYAPGRVSAEMETVVAAMLADRKWDLIIGTAQRARDALALFPQGSIARRLLSTEKKQELYEIIASQASGKQWFVEWQSLFGIAEGTSVSDAVVQKVLDEHSITGWTTANVLRRVRLSTGQTSSLREWALGKGPTIKWRIAHLFGAHPSAENCDLLIGLLSTEHFWVQYGVIRSLVEMAAYASARLRRSIFEKVRVRIPTLSSGILQELGRALLIDPERAPRDWGEHALGLLRSLFSHEASEDRERWSNEIGLVQTLYARSTAGDEADR